MHEGLIEVEPKKWPKEKAFIIFGERNKFFFLLTNWQDKEAQVLVLKNEEFKQSLGLK